MSKKCRYTIYGILAVFIAVILSVLIKFLFFSGLFVPLLDVNGESHIQVEVNQEYQDAGASASYRFQDISSQIETENKVDFTKIGTYEVKYYLKGYDKSAVRTVEVVDTTPPVITLQGPETLRVFEFTQMEDPGVQAYDNNDGDISSHVAVDSQVDMEKQGSYVITYTVTDSSGNTASMERKVEVCEDPTNVKVYYAHDDYDNTAEEWWFEKNKDHERNKGARDEELIRQYDAYYLGPDEKVIYLTFDEGGNDITYIEEIAQILDDNDVDATFFLTRNYIKNNPEFMNSLVDNGHLVANHTWHHYDMPTLANANDIDTFVLELTETEKTFMEVTGHEMKKIFRFPKGGMSLRSLKIVQDLGYSSFFWSHAYYDFAEDVSKQEALTSMMDHYHNGAIYLLHPSNKGNYLAMDEFIKNMKDLGYEFRTVDTIVEPQS